MKSHMLWQPALAGACLLSALVSTAQATTPAIALNQLSTIRTGVYDTGGNGGAEIVAYHPISKRLFFVNASKKSIDVYSIANPAAPVALPSLPLPAAATAGGGPTSVDVNWWGLVAVAAEGATPTDPGTVSFFSAYNGNLLSTVTVGSFPDMLTFTPEGTRLLVANEGSPNANYTIDPEGSVSVIRTSWFGARQTDVRTAGFTAFNNATLDPRIRIFGPGATVAQDLEPEYIAISPDLTTAYVTLQENNAVAVVDISTATVTSLRALGVKDHSLPGNALDGSDRDGPGNTPLKNIRNWPVFGLYQPDNIAAFCTGGQTYYITANEGDAREFPGVLVEEARVSTLNLDTAVFPDAAVLKSNAGIGRLNVSRIGADSDGNGLVDKLYSLGGRSFSIWNAATGAQVFDSGDELENLVATFNPLLHNASNETNTSFDLRSDNKGPEPEALTVGWVNNRIYAFVSLERPGGIAVYDISNPADPDFIQYVNNRVLTGDPVAGTAGDLGPEGLTFVPALLSPNGRPLLLVANEISGTVTVYEVTTVSSPAP